MCAAGHSCICKMESDIHYNYHNNQLLVLHRCLDNYNNLYLNIIMLYYDKLACPDILCLCMVEMKHLKLLNVLISLVLPSQFISIMTNQFHLLQEHSSPQQHGCHRHRVPPYAKISYRDNMFCDEVPTQRDSLHFGGEYSS